MNSTPSCAWVAASSAATAVFAPRGLFGALYWYALYPLHARIFSDLARAIADEAEAAR